MRLQRINTYHSEYLRQFFARRPDLASQSYSQQHAALMDDCYIWADFWSVAMSKLGYQTDEVVANVEPMQKRWAQENNAKYDESSWLFEITAAQVRSFQPEILFVTDYATFSAAFLRQLRSEVASIKLVLGWCGAPYRDASVFGEYDLVLCCIPELVEHFREQGHTAHHLNHAFSSRVLEKINTQAAPNVDFAFMGSIVKRNQFHHQREQLLLDLIEKTDLRLWADISQSTVRERRQVAVRQLAFDAIDAAQRVGVPQSILNATPFVQKVTNWRERPQLAPDVDPRLAQRADSSLFGLEMFQQLHDTRVALNTHIDISPTSASNVRLFEATGVGTCLLTDWKQNIPALFEPDTEVVTYRNSEECAEKARYLLEHETERRAIAQAGQRRTLRDHTYTQRADQLHQIIHSHLGDRNLG